MTKPDWLSIGYFDEFSFGNSAILIWGDAGGLEMLAERLRGLPATKTREMLLHRLPCIRFVRDAQIKTEIVERSTGMTRPDATPEAEFHWGLSSSRANNFADLIAGVAKANRACHQYLDTDTRDEVTVIVSIGEYPERFGEAE